MLTPTAGGGLRSSCRSIVVLQCQTRNRQRHTAAMPGGRTCGDSHSQCGHQIKRLINSDPKHCRMQKASEPTWPPNRGRLEDDQHPCGPAFPHTHPWVYPCVRVRHRTWVLTTRALFKLQFGFFDDFAMSRGTPKTSATNLTRPCSSYSHPQQRLISPTPHLPPKGGIWACDSNTGSCRRPPLGGLKMGGIASLS